MATRKFSIQLMDHVTGEIIQSSGGVVYVAKPGDTGKATLTDDSGAALSNPLALTNGKMEFSIDVATETVDLYGIAPGGQAFQALTVSPSGPNEIYIDTGRKNHVLVIPFDQADFTATVETDSGFDIPSRAVVLPHPIVRVTAIDATETIDVGTKTSESGDPDGFLALASIGTLGLVKGTIANGTPTLGALLYVQDSVNAGDEAREESTASAGKSVVYTTSTGSDTGKGFINIPYLLAA